MTYEVEVKVAASSGGGIRRLKIPAPNEAMALVKAGLELDLQGIARWELIRVTSLVN